MPEYRFRSTVTEEISRYEEGMHVAHEKHTLTNPDLPDVVICVVLRRVLPPGTTLEALHEAKRENSKILEEIARELAEEHGWLE